MPPAISGSVAVVVVVTGGSVVVVVVMGGSVVASTGASVVRVTGGSGDGVTVGDGPGDGSGPATAAVEVIEIISVMTGFVVSSAVMVVVVSEGSAVDNVSAIVAGVVSTGVSNVEVASTKEEK
ncbi:hypothetical protein BG004_007783 [Podila humilis]|nr:hypothetical protein BG004_007783 [Podila humilis]